MRLKIGDVAPSVTLVDLSGQAQTLQSQGRLTMIAFQRFAGCPFCNLRVSQLIKRQADWKDKLDVIVVFDSTLDNLRLHAVDLNPPFAVVADPENMAYQAYGVEHSWLGVIKGSATRFPTMLNALRQGFVPKSFEGRMDTMPASFIVDQDNKIVLAYYGKDEGDYLPFEQIESLLSLAD